MFDTRFVRPLASIENRFLEVLLSSFELHRTPIGVRLRVQFDGTTDAVWNALGKEHVRERTPNLTAKAEQYQSEIDGFLADPERDRYIFNDPEFRFRYVSGGALPVVRLGGRNYYALIYRECFPIGWNLANGGSDSLQEMLNPFVTVERELREELMLADFERQQRYVFDMQSDNPEDMPEHVLARRFWTDRLCLSPTLDEYSRIPTPIKWLDGPDALDVRIGQDERTLKGCFLNVNALDFGIEIDRIAKIRAEDSVRFLDGELLNGCLVGSVVGLFEVDRMNREVVGDANEYLPDMFFYEGRPYTDIQRLVGVLRNSYLPQVSSLAGSPTRLTEWNETPRKLGLCPVTKNLLHVAATYLERERKSLQDYDVFVSFAHEDQTLATQVCEFLSGKAGKRIFFSPRLKQACFADAIDEALDKTPTLIAVTSDPDHLRKSWPEYEYRAFHVLMLNKRKPAGANLVSYVSGCLPGDLPLPLTHYHAITHNVSDPEKSLREILRYLHES